MAYDLQEQESIDQMKAWWDQWGTPITAAVCVVCLGFAAWNGWQWYQRNEAGKAAVIVRSMDGDDVDAVARLPYSSLISDSLYSGTDTPHPRLYGSFPRFIRDFALDRKVVSLEEAVWKMTGLPAQRYHLADRGLVEEGRRADLVLLDPSRIRDRATYAQATLPCEGIEKVYVAGRKAYECGRMVAHDCGRLLRREE